MSEFILKLPNDSIIEDFNGGQEAAQRVYKLYPLEAVISNDSALLTVEMSVTDFNEAKTEGTGNSVELEIEGAGSDDGAVVYDFTDTGVISTALRETLGEKVSRIESMTKNHESEIVDAKARKKRGIISFSVGAVA